jgi:hypothetical protein
MANLGLGFTLDSAVLEIGNVLGAEGENGGRATEHLERVSSMKVL